MYQDAITREVSSIDETNINYNQKDAQMLDLDELNIPDPIKKDDNPKKRKSPAMAAYKTDLERRRAEREMLEGTPVTPVRPKYTVPHVSTDGKQKKKQMHNYIIVLLLTFIFLSKEKCLSSKNSE